MSELTTEWRVISWGNTLYLSVNGKIRTVEPTSLISIVPILQADDCIFNCSVVPFFMSFLIHGRCPTGGTHMTW